jgi:hypothetical protein
LNIISSELSFCEKEVTGPAGEYQYRGEGHGTEYVKKFTSSEVLSGWMEHTYSMLVRVDKCIQSLVTESKEKGPHGKPRHV